MMSALITGNKILVKVDPKVSLVIEQFIRLLLKSGLPPTDVDLMHTDADNARKFVVNTPQIKLIQFTGSHKVASELSKITNGKIKIRETGINWKCLGPGVLKEIDYIAWQADHDAFSFSGQNCSSQRIMFAHDDWMKAGIVEKIQAFAEKRSLQDLTIVPSIKWSNERLQKHLDALLKVPGAKLLFGGDRVESTIPDCYGSFKPTLVVRFFSCGYLIF